jgi:hypothetical protein
MFEQEVFVLELLPVDRLACKTKRKHLEKAISKHPMSRSLAVSTLQPIESSICRQAPFDQPRQ